MAQVRPILHPGATQHSMLLLSPQSPWIIDGQRKGESSVEERIADAVLPHFKADKHKFMTAGQCSVLPVKMRLGMPRAGVVFSVWS